MDMYQILAQLNSVGGDSKQALTEGKKAKPDFLDVDKDGDKKEPMKKAAKDKEQVEEAAECLDEKWGVETKVAPSEKGKYKGKNKAELQKQYNALKDKGPHKKGSSEYEKMKELQFAIRAKSDWGKVSEAIEEGDVEEGNEFTQARLAAIRAGKPTFRVGGKVHKVTGNTSDERRIEEDDDMEVGKSRKTQFGKVTQVAPNVTRHTRDYDREEERDDDDDDAPKAKGRPKGAGRKIGAKGPSGRSKLMREEGPGDDVQAAIELLMNNGYTVGKLGSAEEAPLDEKAVSKKQQRFMGMVHAAQQGEKPASAEVAKVAKSMGKKDAEEFAATKHKGLPEKKKAKKEESVEETTTSGSVATAPAESSSKSKGGMSFGKGVYEAKLAESFEAKLDSIMGGTTISIDDSGNMSVSVGQGDSFDSSSISPETSGEMSVVPQDTSATDTSSSLDDILRLSGVEPSSSGYTDVCPGCGSAECTCDELDEAGIANTPDEKYSDIDTMINTLSGGLNGRKSTGQTTVPIINKDPARQGVGAVAEQVREQAESHLWQLYKKIENK